MVELTLSGVTRGPGKFAPAPKVKPRPGRARGAAAPGAGGPAASASAASATPTPSSTPAPETPPASIEKTADAAAPLTKVAATTPHVSAAPVAPRLNVEPSVTSIPAPHVTTSITSKIDVAGSVPSTKVSIPTVSATPLPTPSLVVKSVAKRVSVPFQLPTRPSVPVVLTSHDIFNDHEEDPAEHIPVPATTRINAPPRIVSTAPPRPATASVPDSNPATDGHALPPAPATKPPVPKSNAPPKVMAASRTNGNAIATPGRTRVEVVVPIPSPQQKASRSRAATAEVDAVEPAFDVEDHEEEMELNEYTIAYASLDTLIKHKFPAGKLSRAEELRRQQQKEAKKRKGKQEREGTPGSVRDPTPVPEPVREATPAPVNLSGPRLIMVDGQLQLDKESLVIRTGATEEEDLELIEEASNRHVTSASFARPRTARVRWTAEATDRFYEGLSYFGSDFSMICLMFPELNRKQVKQKYNAEERTNAKRVTKALLMKRKTPSDLAGEMKERIKERVTKRKAKAHESDDEDELLAVKRAKSESAAKLEAGATPPKKVDEDDGEDVMDLDENNEQPQPQQTQAEDLIRSLIAQQEQLEELGAPAAVEVSMALPSRPSSGNVAGPSFKPRIGPKVGARKARSQPTSAAASPLSTPIPLPAPSTQEAPPVAPDPTAGVPIVAKVSRVRMVPTIGAARKPQPPPSS